MQYHIQTAPIWDAFRTSDGCPICKLYETVQARIVKQYVGEAVMEPEFRIKVNKRGFCAHHLGMLFDGGNKLGVALQVHTRTDHILGEIDDISGASGAKKLAARLNKTMDTCVICDEADEIMDRYCEAVAMMFFFEPEFPALFRSSNGFCMPHFTALLNFVGRAGKAEKAYAAALTAKQRETLRKLNSSLERFTNRFDYRSTDKFSGATDDALKNSINALKGRIIDK